MWWAYKAGIAEAKPYALSAQSSSGHCSRKLKIAMGHSDSTDLYVLQVPGHAKHDLARTLHLVQVLPAHEQLAEHMASDYVCRHKLSELYRKKSSLPFIGTTRW